jgi:hypothetical protein
VSNLPKKSRKRSNSCPKTPGEASCASACSTDVSGRDEKAKYLDECLALVPKLEMGLDAIRSATISQLETLPSSTVSFIADGAALHGLTDLTCFAAAYKAALVRGEIGPDEASLIEILDKAFAMLSLHLEVARADAAWNADWDRELLAALLFAANHQVQDMDDAAASNTSQAVHKHAALKNTQSVEFKWRKESASLFDGRESLFVKLWGALSQTAVALSKAQWAKPVTSTKQSKRAKRPVNEDDPFAEVFR